jgi:zeta-carotene desaturase
VGCERLLLAQDDLTLEWADGHERTRLRCPPIVAPFHLLAGLIGLRIPFSAKVAAVRFGLSALGAGPPGGETLAVWFERTGQGPDIRRLLWDPPVLATLNEVPERVSAVLFHRVFRDAFLKDHRASRLVFLRAGWSDLAERIAHYVESRGGQVLRRCRAESINVENGRVRGVHLRRAAEGRQAVAQGVAPAWDTLEADAVILAVPWHAVPALLPGELREQVPFGALPALGGSSIVSVELWLDRIVVDPVMVGLRGGDYDWVFDKGRLLGRPGAPQHLSFVTSAATRLASMRNADLVGSAEVALRGAFAGMSEATVTRSLVLREPRATFSATPEAELLRPGASTATTGLYLAGDWTATGLPATIEGAVRSGLAAARALEADLASSSRADRSTSVTSPMADQK